MTDNHSVLFQGRHRDHLRVHGVRRLRRSSDSPARGGGGSAAAAAEEAVDVGDVRQHGALQQEDNLNHLQPGAAQCWKFITSAQVFTTG